MDPVSQAALGIVAAQNTAPKTHLFIASILGMLSGMAPDLDVFIRSETDPLLFLEYHRQFTHSLIFIPIGGLICGLILHALLARRYQFSFKHTYLYCTIGYATHGLLDSCTSYGTQLFWPFSDTRVSWSNISIVDPLFTIPIVVLIIMAVVKKNKRYTKIATVWLFCYLALGVVQRERAELAGMVLAASRNHTPIRIDAKPGFGTLLLWKVIYETEDRFYVDGVRAGTSIKTYPGDSVAKLDLGRDFPWLDANSQQAQDVMRFKWFSDGYIARHSKNPNRIIDMRYSMLPNKIEGLWMIELNQSFGPQQHVGYAHEHDNNPSMGKQLWDMLTN